MIYDIKTFSPLFSRQAFQQKNIVVTTNYVARARGVSKLSYIKDAVVKCPDLVLVSGEDLSNYRENVCKNNRYVPATCLANFKQNHKTSMKRAYIIGNFVLC